MHDVEQTMIFGTRCGTVAVFRRQVKSSPDAAVGIAITQQSDFFRRHVWYAEWIQDKNELAVLPAVDKRIEKTWSRWCVDVSQRAQVNILAQLFAEKLLVAAIQLACFGRLRTAVAHRRIRRRLDLIERIVSEAQHKMRERFAQRFIVNENRKSVFFDLSRWR